MSCRSTKFDIDLNTGIGRATAISFALEGCGQIAISDRNLEGLKETEKFMKDVSSNIDILINQVDTTEEAQIENMVQTTVARFGRLDYAVNSAGLFPFPVPSFYFHVG